jgi:hypothetical protein
MHEAKPYGHLTLNGAAIDDGTLARMTGVPVAEVHSLMDELRKAGVFSLTSKGVVFSRRMTADARKAAIARKNANKRWQQADEVERESDDGNADRNANRNAKSLRDEELPPVVPQGGRRRRPKGAGHFFEAARGAHDGTEGSQAGSGNDRRDAGRLPEFAVEHQ